MSETRSTKRKLSFQPLENRNMLAGNVFGGLMGTQLSLGGDAMDNQFEITEIAPNAIQVTGLGTTTINGAPSQVFAANLIENIVVRTGMGHDEVIVRNVSLTDTPYGNLQIITDAGDDLVDLGKVSTTESIVINTGDHNDAVNARLVKTRGYFNTDSGNGHDSGAFDTIRAAEMNVDMHDGDDMLKIRRAKIATDLRIHTGTQNDEVRLEQVTARNDVDVETCQGEDRVFMRRVRAGNNVELDTGGDVDFASLGAVSARNDLLANLGAGDDTLIMNSVKALNHIEVQLEDGNDFARINRAKAHDVYVDTGDDGDKLLIRNTHAIADLHALMGNGDDKLKIEGSSAVNPFFDGGNGYDTLVDRPNAFDEVAASINFEAIV
jgi:hypothetical protein